MIAPNGGGSTEPGGQAADWLQPRVEQQPLQRYWATLRERAWLIVVTTLLTTLAAVAYVATASKVYEAEADLLVTPVSRDAATLAGLALIRESSDPTRDVETAARLVTTIDVAGRVQRQLGLPDTPQSLLEQVDAKPVAQSNIVAVTAEARTPEAAQQLANAFADAAVANLNDQLQAQLDTAIERLRPRVARGGAATEGPNSLAAQLSELETLRAAGDPTMRVETRAAVPESPVSPRPKLSVAAGLIAGLVLGLGGAFALQVLDPRLRREEQLRALYRLPTLARIPRVRDGGGHAIAPERLPPGILEAYRTFRATLAASRSYEGGSRSILITSASPSEGKTTTAINLASSLALAGNRVILIEADLRRPAVGRALGEHAAQGTDSVLLERVSLDQALVNTQAYEHYLRLLLAEDVGGAGGWMADRLFLPAADKLLAEAKQLADYVIIDSPPLSEVIDALPLAQLADEVVVVVRIGKTHITKLTQLGELLARHGVRPVGFAVVGVPGAPTSGYYYGSGRQRPAAGAPARRGGDADGREAVRPPSGELAR